MINSKNDGAVTVAVTVAGAARYSVSLASTGNPDYRQTPGRSLPGVPRLSAQCGTIREAQLLVREYLDCYDLGGGNWVGGELVFHTDSTQVVVGYFAYNGRLWSDRLGGVAIEVLK